MQIENTYPRLTHKKRQLTKLKNFGNVFLLAAARIVIFINLITGWYPRCIIVCAWIWLFWAAIYDKPLDEDNIIKRISSFWINSCLLLVILDWLSPKSFAFFVVPIVIFGMAIILSIIFFADYKHQKTNITTFYRILFLSLWIPIIMLFFWVKMNWPMIVTISVSGGIMLIWIILFFKPLMLELKKKFHV